ncbi:hypothetical protein TNCV_1380111 [Trichonephila clavipes]|nr:hypothetical protein TNCV_1380111 [Trichonephila clavipes]
MNFSYHSQYETTFKDIKQKIYNLQKNFIIVYIDKVPGNYAVIYVIKVVFDTTGTLKTTTVQLPIGDNKFSSVAITHLLA